MMKKYRPMTIHRRPIIPILILNLIFFTFSPQLQVKAVFNPNTTTWQVGSLNSQAYYRTNFASEEIPTYARVKRLSQGIYDPVANITFIVYGGGEITDPDDGQPLTAADPFIVGFDHTNRRWLNPVKLITSGFIGDTHHYGQIIIDQQGYLHVLFSAHIHNEIWHFKSNQPRKIDAGWSQRQIPNTKGSSYGAAFIDKDGEIYYFYRQTFFNSALPTNPNQVLFYEPEYYIKSSDRGTTWQGPFPFLDTGGPSAYCNPTQCPQTCATIGCTCLPNGCLINDTNWTTSYISDLEPTPNADALYVSFTENYAHGHKWATQYLVRFSFTTDTFQTMKGTNLGKTLTYTQYHQQNCCTLEMSPESLASEMSAKNINYSQSIVFENSSLPSVYYTSRDANWRGLAYKATWNGNSWTKTDLTPTLGHVVINDGVYTPQTGTILLAKSVETVPEATTWYACLPDNLRYQYPIKLFSNQSGSWQNTRLFTATETNGTVTEDHREWEKRGTSYAGFIRNFHPAIQGLFIIPKYTCEIPNIQKGIFTKSYPIGAHFIFGAENTFATPIPTATPLLGDANQDGHVNITDLSIVLAKFDQTVSSTDPADLNDDGLVDIFDYNLVVSSFGQSQ